MKVRGWTWATSWAVVGLWASVTLLVAMASLAALFTPTWFVRHSPSPPVMFGVWAWCRGGLNDQRCAAVGQGVGDADGALPSAVWVMVGAVYGGGGALLAVTGLAALLTPILPTTHARAALAHVAGNIQAAAGAQVGFCCGVGCSFSWDISAQLQNLDTELEKLRENKKLK
ncbi:hypothetical protein E2C01_052397 [Portunus trituberculatus]|uniref:Uncharacterized protein n=1 Tax=Portunus trituberculatus TaxID=210409 RepID=A0A5B7GLQ5_PORTR|nr:hypothetical protein [Portunus trituberculatus]